MKERLENLMVIPRFVGAIMLGIITPVILVITAFIAVVGGILTHMTVMLCKTLDYRIGGPSEGYIRHTLGWIIKVTMSLFNWRSVRLQIDDVTDWTWGS